jgi:ABC-2 type transport system ATP-binding protein
MSAAIHVERLHKRFGSMNAVDDVSFSVQAHSCCGLLGPNGAGKTTLIEILEGIQQPTSGQIHYFGALRPARELYQRIGLQFQQTALPDHQTVQETLQFFAALYQETMAFDALVDLCGLGGLLARDTRRLSGGQRQRLLLALALLNDPDLLFLDEPSSGLDPQSRRELWAVLQQVHASGKTILLTTHDMQEAELLCDDLILMDQGRIVLQGNPQSLLSEHVPDTQVSVPNGCVSASFQQLWHGQLMGSELVFRTAQLPELLAQLQAADVPWSHIRLQPPDLNDLFITVTGKALRS